MYAIRYVMLIAHHLSIYILKRALISRREDKRTYIGFENVVEVGVFNYKTWKIHHLLICMERWEDETRATECDQLRSVKLSWKSQSSICQYLKESIQHHPAFKQHFIRWEEEEKNLNNVKMLSLTLIHNCAVCCFSILAMLILSIG